MRVEPDDGDAGLRPQTRVERTGAGKTIRFDDARVGTHSRLVHITLQAANRFLGRNARHGQIAIGVVHGGNQHRSQRVRVKNRAAILAGMHRMFQRLDMHINIGVATQRRGQRRNLSGPVARIGHNDHIGSELVPVLFDERNEARRTHLLLTFDEHLDVHLQIVFKRFQRTGMNGDSTAVVRGSAAVQTRVDFSADERVGVPYARIRHRLHVMVRVQQHRRRILADVFGTDDLPSARRAVGVVRLHHLRIDADLAQQVRHELRGTLHMIGGDAFRGNRLQGDLLVQHVDDAVEIRLDARADLFGS